MPDDPARVFTVVLNHEHPDDTLACLRSVGHSTHRWQVPVVVDNASSEDAVAALESELVATTIIRSGENLGYAGGNNLGVTYALDRHADFVWILNPDVTVEAETLERLLDTAARFPEDGLFGPRVLYGASRPEAVSSDGGMLDRARALAPRNRNDGAPSSQLPSEGTHAVDYVTGSCLLVRRQVFEEVGLLPERYFLYFEEADFALRAAEAGWSARVDVSARAHHYKRSFGPLPTPYYVYYYIRGRLLFAAEHAPDQTDAAEASLDEFVNAWATRVVQAAPEWRETFDRLVSWAIEDGLAGRGGRRDDVHAIAVPEASE